MRKGMTWGRKCRRCLIRWEGGRNDVGEEVQAMLDQMGGGEE